MSGDHYDLRTLTITTAQASGEDASMPDVFARSGSSTTDSAVSATTPEKAQPPQQEPVQPATLPPAQPAESADPSEAERARGTQLYQQGQWQVMYFFLLSN